MTQTLLAPPPVLDFSITAEQVEQITNEIIAAELAVNNSIAALKPEERTYENILVPLTTLENELAGKLCHNPCLYSQFIFAGKAQLVSSLSQFSPEASVRDASIAAETKYDQFSIEQCMRHDFYSVITDYISKTDLKSLDHEDARYLSKMELSFRRNGLHLAEEKRDELAEIRKRSSEISIEFNKNWALEDSSKCN